MTSFNFQYGEPCMVIQDLSKFTSWRSPLWTHMPSFSSLCLPIFSSLPQELVVEGQIRCPPPEWGPPISVCTSSPLHSPPHLCHLLISPVCFSSSVYSWGISCDPSQPSHPPSCCAWPVGRKFSCHVKVCGQFGFIIFQQRNICCYSRHGWLYWLSGMSRLAMTPRSHSQPGHPREPVERPCKKLHWNCTPNHIF